MLNEEKIKVMTRLAIYEQNEGKKELPMAKYYRNDYVAVQLIKSSIAMTLGYLLLIFAVALINIEELLPSLLSMDLVSLGRKLLLLYVILFAFNLLVTYVISDRRFKASRTSLNEYNLNLKEMMRIYKKEENAESQQ